MVTIKLLRRDSAHSLGTFHSPIMSLMSTYAFFKVKNERLFGSSFCDEAGSVCDRLSAPV